MTAERFAAAAKIILDEDRRADRERIAALERTIGFLNLRVSNEEQRANNWQAMVAGLNKQLDELTEKCAALVVERNQLTVENNHLHGDNKRLTDSLAMGNPYGPGLVNKAPTLRIDPDMSDPQPGKLLVVRLDQSDVVDAREEVGCGIDGWRNQFVGFLVETPAVEVKRTPKVGDKVRIIKQVDLPRYGKAGQVGTVTQVDSDASAWVDGVGVDGPWCYSLEDLEVIK